MNKRDFLKAMTVSYATFAGGIDRVNGQTFQNIERSNSANPQSNSDAKIYTNPGHQELAASSSRANEQPLERVTSNSSASAPTLLWVRRNNDEYRLDFTGPKGKKTIEWLLRDIKADRQGIPDPRMLYTLAWMQAYLALHGYHVCFDILSGLRMPSTNNAIEGAALRSYHLPDSRGVFKAVDFRARPIPSAYLGKLAYLLKQGGVGFYNRDFTHIDTGELIGKHGTQRVWFNR